MGAWTFVTDYVEWAMETAGRPKGARPRYAGRPAAAATATGLMSKHLAQLKAFMDQAFADEALDAGADEARADHAGAARAVDAAARLATPATAKVA